jgi:ribosomal protein L12E/L44/L45/RPP1/RPP2
MRSLAAAGVVVAVVALSIVGAAIARTVAIQPTLTVTVLGSGSVTSTPAGISCPGKCTATFAAGTSVRLTPKSKTGSPFLRWGGSCTGTGACRVKVSALAAVAAQFAPGPTPTPTTLKSVAEPGSYSVDSNTYKTFFVALDGRSVENISLASVPIACSPPEAAAPGGDQLVIPRAAIKPDGSFAGKASQSGVFAGFPATFTYSFAGHFTAPTGTSAAAAAGSFREDIVFKSNVTHTCTTNNQPWTAVKSGPIPKQTSLVAAGNYSVNSNTYKTFSVAAGGKSVQNISIASVPITCVPAAAAAPGGDKIVIPQTSIGADGSFNGTASQTGVFAGVQAKFTYSFAGDFEGLTSTGVSSAAGLYREDIVFTDSAGTHTCTSNNQSWTATR